MTLPPDEIERRKESSQRPGRRRRSRRSTAPGSLKALDVFAKSWLAHDGAGFSRSRSGSGWRPRSARHRDLAPFRSRRSAPGIMEAYAIPRDGGLDALARVLPFRAYSFLNPSRIERQEPAALLHDVLPRPGDPPAQRPPGLSVPARRQVAVRDVRARRRLAHRDALPALPAGPGLAGPLRLEFPPRRVPAAAVRSRKTRRTAGQPGGRRPTRRGGQVATILGADGVLYR